MKSYPDPFALAPTPYTQNTPEICASALFIIVDKRDQDKHIWVHINLGMV